MAAHQPANWTCIDPRGCLLGAMVKWAEWIGPTSIVGPVSGIVRGRCNRPNGRRNNVIRPFPLIKAIVSFVFFHAKYFFMYVGHMAMRGTLD